MVNCRIREGWDGIREVIIAVASFALCSTRSHHGIYYASSLSVSLRCWPATNSNSIWPSLDHESEYGVMSSSLSQCWPPRNVQSTPMIACFLQKDRLSAVFALKVFQDDAAPDTLLFLLLLLFILCQSMLLQQRVDFLSGPQMVVNLSVRVLSHCCKFDYHRPKVSTRTLPEVD